MRVLVVEDDEGIREGLTQLLSEHVETLGVSNVPEALSALQNTRYDLVIADLRLGDQHLGGRMVCEAAQARSMPVALLTASPLDKVERALGGLAPEHLISKPFQLDEIEALLVRYGEPELRERIPSN